MSIFKFSPKFAALTAASALLLTACVAGESEVKAGAATSAESLTIDFATYNPLSLVIKEKGWLEDELDGVEVTWVQSAGSNKAKDRKSTRLNSSHVAISYAVFCLKK